MTDVLVGVSGTEGIGIDVVVGLVVEARFTVFGEFTGPMGSGDATVDKLDAFFRGVAGVGAGAEGEVAGGAVGETIFGLGVGVPSAGVPEPEGVGVRGATFVEVGIGIEEVLNAIPIAAGFVVDRDVVGAGHEDEGGRGGGRIFLEIENALNHFEVKVFGALIAVEPGGGIEVGSILVVAEGVIGAIEGADEGIRVETEVFPDGGVEGVSPFASFPHERGLTDTVVFDDPVDGGDFLVMGEGLDPVGDVEVGEGRVGLGWDDADVTVFFEVFEDGEGSVLRWLVEIVNEDQIAHCVERKRCRKSENLW